MTGIFLRVVVAGWLFWIVSVVAVVGEIPTPPPEQQNLVRDWRIDEGNLTIRGTLIEFGREGILIREESGQVENVAFEWLDPADLFRALKWEEERLIFPHLAGLEFETLILPEENLPFDEAFAFVWKQARELRPGLSKNPPRVTLVGTGTMPVVSARITGRLRAVHALDLLCQQVGARWTLADGAITEADWIYENGVIMIGRTAAMRELETFKQKERRLSHHQKLVKLIADAAGFTIEADIQVRPR